MENNGFGVVTGELAGYAQHTRHIATELHTLATHRVSSVRKIASADALAEGCREWLRAL